MNDKTTAENSQTFASQSGKDLEKLEIELLLEAIFRQYGYDFRNYAPSSVYRRVHFRRQLEKLQSVTALTEKVLHDVRAAERLIADFSINVTEMFRDPDFFQMFRTKAVPLLKKLPFIRIWHAGCATGEEVYSMAILLHEEGIYHKTRLYATDINEKVLQKAKQGEFPLNLMQNYTCNYVQSGGKASLSEYYSASSRSIRLDDFLKEKMIFAQHNLVTDGSINEFHVIICRNVLIYFNKDLQEHVHQLFYNSLSPEGILGLGKREGLALTKFASGYEELDASAKLYLKHK